MTTGKAKNLAVTVIVIVIAILSDFGDASFCKYLHCVHGRCIALARSAYCECEPGYRASLCQLDVNECRGKKTPCHPDAVCTNTKGSYKCTCRPGLTGDGFNCSVSEKDPCLSSPCKNGGICEKSGGGGFYCICKEGFLGLTCENVTDPCISSPCKNGGTCEVSGGGGFNCTCTEGFQGLTCETGADPCGSSPCKNGGICEKSGGGGFYCICKEGFLGLTCENVTDPCISSPCKNGGTCEVSGGGGFNCTCTAGFQGLTCENETDPCISSPCKNGGICGKSRGGGFNCTCTEGFEGLTCENETDPCISSPCKNGGTCEVSGGGGFNCTCTAGFQGLTCETGADPCGSSPCKNGGICEKSGGGGFYCICKEGFLGLTCENVTDPCISSPCKNGGTCEVSGGGGFNCTCTAGFQGLTCENETDPCISSPCKNGGICGKSRGGGFNCTCTEGFEGLTCENETDPCLSSPCKNGGICGKSGGGGFKCRCTEGFEGLTCKTDINECDDRTDNCYDNEFCTNTYGSYNCSCPLGFEGNGRNCSAADKCLSKPCKNEGICEKADGALGFNCRCLLGFTGPTCEKKCEQEKMDILLIEDTSSSISKENYRKIKDFEVELVSYSHIKHGIINVALMAFAGRSRVIFPLKSYSDNKTAAVEAVNVPQHEGGGTFLGDAIQMAVSDVFVESNGDRQDAENVVILFTDGQSSQTSVISKNIGKLLSDAAVFVVPLTAEADNSTINLVASPPYQDHVFPMTDPLALDEIKQRTIYERCGKEFALKE